MFTDALSAANFSVGKQEPGNLDRIQINTVTDVLEDVEYTRGLIYDLFWLWEDCG